MTAPENAAPRGGRILTFYSYKGGTGRTMALANVAWILASQGKRVLTIDWDLEAPGLHRFFAPFLADPNLSESDGLIDFLTAYVVSATKAAPDGATKGDRWYESYADIKRYAEPLQWVFSGGGSIDLVGAGRQNLSYGSRVNAFDWEGFYRRFGGGAFLDDTIRQMKQAYDFILIDSRTGISDTSGISTIHLPDALVVFYTLNNQSIEGASGVAAHVHEARQRSVASGEPAVFPIFPVATRVELAEKAKLEARRVLARNRFSGFLQTIPERAGRDPEDYWGEMEVLYEPYYAYEETLATIADLPKLRNSILAAFERLCDRVTNGEISRLGDMSESKRQEALQLYARMAPRGLVPVAAETPEVSWDIFVFASGQDAEAAGRLYHLLSSNYKVFYDRQSILPGESWTQAISGALERSRAVLVLFSTKGQTSERESVQELLDAARRQQERDKSFKLIPVQLEPDAEPPADFLRQYNWLVVKSTDMQDAALQVRRILGVQIDESPEARLERLRAELDQAVEDKTRLRLQQEKLEAEVRSASTDRGQLAERAANLERQVKDVRRRTVGQATVLTTAAIVLFSSLTSYMFYDRQRSVRAEQAARLAASAYEVSNYNKELSLVLARNAVQREENSVTIGSLRSALQAMLGLQEVAQLPVTAMIQKALEIQPRELTFEERARYLQ